MMGKLLSFLGRTLAMVLISDRCESDVKIQFRTSNDIGWQDHGCIRGDRESINPGLLAASGTFLDADVRAVDSGGRVVDFR
jgi:hypothetical protein